MFMNPRRSRVADSSCFWVIVIMVALPLADSASQQLSVNYYSRSCPNVEALVKTVVKEKLAEAPASAPGTIRLFFHDCFVEGCDASILVSSTSKHSAEKDAEDNNDIPNDAFDVINKAKAAIEAKCPGTVSCADILAIAARDFIVLTGGPNYHVKKGRRDGRVSHASRVKGNLPLSNFTVNQLLRTFSSKGLNRSDMVALSGAHTIGFSHCSGFAERLYNYRKTNKADPSMDPKLLKALRMSCPISGGNQDVTAPFDVKTPFAFDNLYFQNVEQKLGLLQTDQALLFDPRTRSLVRFYARYKSRFFWAFAGAMDKMGSIAVKNGKRRRNPKRL